MKEKYRIYWLKVGDVIKLGDYCWDVRLLLPVKNIGSNSEFTLSKNHHPHYRIVPI